MFTTSIQLLERLRQPADDAAWDRFVQLYTPLLLRWARRLGLQEADAADLVQDVFTLLVQRLPEFRYDAGQSFRAWLYTVLVNRWRDWPRRPQVQLAGDVAGPAPADDLGEADYRQYLVGRALRLMQTDFAPATWQACWEHVGHGRPAREVAAELGMTVAAVYNARSRVLRRLRQELEGLLD